jgi:hypothetical protein
MSISGQSFPLIEIECVVCFSFCKSNISLLSRPPVLPGAECDKPPFCGETALHVSGRAEIAEPLEKTALIYLCHVSLRVMPRFSKMTSFPSSDVLILRPPSREDRIQ